MGLLEKWSGEAGKQEARRVKGLQQLLPQGVPEARLPLLILTSLMRRQIQLQLL